MLSACSVSVVGVAPVMVIGAATVMSPASRPAPAVVMVTAVPALSAVSMVVFRMEEPVALGVHVPAPKIPPVSVVGAATMVTFHGSISQVPALPFAALALMWADGAMSRCAALVSMNPPSALTPSPSPRGRGEEASSVPLTLTVPCRISERTLISPPPTP